MARGAASVTLEAPSRHVVHVLAGTGFGGAERVALSLVQLARQDGYAVSLEGAPGTRLGLRESGLSSPSDEETVDNWAKAAHSRLRARGPTLVHVHLSTPSMLGYALQIIGQLPALFTFHLLPERQWPLDRRYGLPSKWVLAAASRFKRRLFFNTVSATDQRLLERLVRTGRLATIINAPPLVDVDESRGPAAWPGDGTRLLAVGRLVPQKGYDRLLATLASQEVGALSWHLAVVGDGPEKETLVQLCQTLGLSDRVTWLGAVTSAPWLTQADLVISASRYEGMPLVPLEAVREGAPILLSDIPPHRELFETWAPQSLLPTAERDWPRHLASLISSENARRNLSAAQSQLQSICSPVRQWQEYAGLYTSIVTGK